jgi:hypothetical protein
MPEAVGMKAQLWSPITLAFGLLVRLAAAVDQQHPLIPEETPSLSSKNPFTEKFADFVAQALQDWHVAGLAISVVDGNDTFAEVRPFTRYLLEQKLMRIPSTGLRLRYAS